MFIKPDEDLKKVKFEYKFLIIYLIIGGLWILLTDLLAVSIFSDTHLLTHFQTYKGLFYVAVTAVIFFLIIRSYLKKLRKAEEKIRESDQLKTTFLRNISHDLRTPMNGIMGFAGLLQQEHLKEGERKEFSDNIIKSSNRLLGFFNNILELSLLESGNRKFNRVNFGLNTFLNEICSELNLNKPDKITIECKKESNDDPEYQTDKEILKSIFKNLVSIAINSTPDGKILFGYHGRNGSTEFFVKDNGEGLNPQLREKILEDFSMANAAMAYEIGESGLPLELCKGYAELMEGYFRVASEPGTGNEFYFRV
jgi:signal transduction histidine kinase